jgi:hypothetical protein
MGYKLEFKASNIQSPVGLGVAAITGSITKIDIIDTLGNVQTITASGGGSVSLAANQEFDVRVYVDVTNPGGGNWTMAVTVKDTQGGNQIMELYSVSGATHQVDSFLIQNAESVSHPFKMPSANTILGIKLWAYPQAWPAGKTGFITAVPKSSW